MNSEQNQHRAVALGYGAGEVRINCLLLPFANDSAGENHCEKSLYLRDLDGHHKPMKNVFCSSRQTYQEVLRVLGDA